MGKLIEAGIFFVLAFLISRYLKRTAANSRDSASLLAASTSVFWVGLLISASIVLFSTFRVVPAGSVGIVSVMGKVQDTPIYPGFSLINPIAEVTTMSTQIQKHSAKYNSSSKDLQKVHVDMTLNFSLNAAKAPEVFQKVGIDYAAIIIDSAAQEV